MTTRACVGYRLPHPSPAGTHACVNCNRNTPCRICRRTRPDTVINDDVSIKGQYGCSIFSVAPKSEHKSSCMIKLE